MQATSPEFHADALNTERRVVLKLRAESEKNNNNKWCVAFSIFRVAQVVSSFCPLPPFELKGELLVAFKGYVVKGKVLTTADRYALSRVTTVGNDFLRGSSDFRSIDYGNPGLKSIDLSPLSNVTTVGNYFLCYCTDLKTIDLSPLSNLTNVGSCFLIGCSGVKTVNLSPLSNITTVADHFLSNCKVLKSIDLTPLSNVTTVGDDFLGSCKGLKTIELSPLSNVTTVGHNFLSFCSDTVQAQGKEFLSSIRRDWNDEAEDEDDEAEAISEAEAKNTAESINCSCLIN